jgi:ribosomal protein L24E
MPTCIFCRRHFKEPRGITIFTFEGKSINYCSSKCQKNAVLGRDSKKVGWAKRMHKESADKKALQAEE